jgi:hypothetical protein
MDSINGAIRLIGVILKSQNQYWRSKGNKSRNEEAGMAQSEQVQEGSSLDYGIKGKVQVQWIVDSGASECHVKESVPVCNKKYLKHPISVTIARKDKILVLSVIGDVYCKTSVNGKQELITIEGVLVVPNLTLNLLSVDKIKKKGLKIVFESNKGVIYCKNDTVAKAVGESSTYKLTTGIEIEEPSANFVQIIVKFRHLRMGHLGWNNLKKLRDMVDGVNRGNASKCLSSLPGRKTD